MLLALGKSTDSMEGCDADERSPNPDRALVREYQCTRERAMAECSVCRHPAATGWQTGFVGTCTARRGRQTHDFRSLDAGPALYRRYCTGSKGDPFPALGPRTLRPAPGKQ